MRPLSPIPAERLTAMLGRKVHVIGWAAGCVFRLHALEGGMAVLLTPKTGRRYTVAVDRLAYLRSDEESQ